MVKHFPKLLSFSLSLFLSLFLVLIILGCANPASSKSIKPGNLIMATTTSAVSSHYIIFFYKDDLEANKNHKFVVLPAGTTAPTSYNAIGAYDGHITLLAKKEERAGLIFLPGTPTLDGTSSSAVRVPTATLAASTTYKLYGAGVNDEVKSIDVKTGARGLESPFRVQRNGNLLTRIYVGKKYGIVPFSEFNSDNERNAPSGIILQRSGQQANVQLFSFGAFQSNYNDVANLVDMGGTGGGANSAEGVLLFLNSAHTSLPANARNLGLNSSIGVISNDGSRNATSIRLRFSDDNENQRSITNAQGFATSPAVN